APAPGGAANQHGGAAVRPRLRGVGRARLPGRRRRDRPRPAAPTHLFRARPGGRRGVAAGGSRRAGSGGARGSAVDPGLRGTDARLAWAAYRWTEGDDLGEVLDDSDLTAGDFVRWIKQLIDLSGQVADAAGAGPLRENARDVVRRIRRGVVAVAPMED